MKIDEHVAAQQPVHFLFPGGVTAHQALDGGGLVRAVVVDVEAGMLLPARHDRIDEALEHTLLGLLVERPSCLVPAVPLRDAEQVLQTAVRREGVPFEVEEDVAGRRLR